MLPISTRDFPLKIGRANVVERKSWKGDFNFDIKYFMAAFTFHALLNFCPLEIKALEIETTREVILIIQVYTKNLCGTSF